MWYVTSSTDLQEILIWLSKSWCLNWLRVSWWHYPYPIQATQPRLPSAILQNTVRQPPGKDQFFAHTAT